MAGKVRNNSSTIRIDTQRQYAWAVYKAKQLEPDVQIDNYGLTAVFTFASRDNNIAFFGAYQDYKHRGVIE